MNIQTLKSVVLAVVVVLSATMVACDPGLTIRQAGSPADKNSSVILHVKPSRQLIGSEMYAPQLTVTNSSEAPVTTGAELSTKQKTYSASSPRPQEFPKEILPKQTESLTLLFRLDDSVRQTFRQSAELRVHYKAGNGEDTARTTIEVGPLDDSH